MGISRGCNYTCPSHHLPKRNRNGGVRCRTLGALPAPDFCDAVIFIRLNDSRVKFYPQKHKYLQR